MGLLTIFRHQYPQVAAIATQTWAGTQAQPPERFADEQWKVEEDRRTRRAAWPDERTQQPAGGDVAQEEGVQHVDVEEEEPIN